MSFIKLAYESSHVLHRLLATALCLLWWSGQPIHLPECSHRWEVGTRRFRRWATAGDELECHSPPPDSPSIAIWTPALCSEGRSYPPIHTERRQTHPAPGGPESTEAARTLPAGAFHPFTLADHGRWSGHMDLEATARCFDCCPADDIWLCTEVKDDRSCIDNIDLKTKQFICCPTVKIKQYLKSVWHRLQSP